MQPDIESTFKKDYNLLTPSKPQFSLIWLHGLGDVGKTFIHYFMQDSSPVHKGCRVLLPTAPIREVTINKGRCFRSWFDIKKWMNQPGSDQEKYNLDELKQSMSMIDQIVEDEIDFWKEKGLKNEQDICGRIFVGGLSQGCASSLIYALTCKRKLAGAIGFSGFMFTSFDLINKNNLPMLIVHGDRDETIRYEDAQPTYEQLKGSKHLRFELIKGLEHWVIDQECDDELVDAPDPETN